MAEYKRKWLKGGIRWTVPVVLVTSSGSDTVCVTVTAVSTRTIAGYGLVLGFSS